MASRVRVRVRVSVRVSATSSAASSAVAKWPRYTRLPSRPTRASKGFTLLEVLTYTPTKPVCLGLGIRVRVRVWVRGEGEGSA